MRIYRPVIWILRAADAVRGQLELGLSGGLGGAEVLLRTGRNDDTTDFNEMKLFERLDLVLDSLVIYRKCTKNSVVLNLSRLHIIVSPWIML